MDLMSHLEAATEGSRELDAWIHAPAAMEIRCPSDTGSFTFYEAIDKNGEQIWLLSDADFPHYTTSIDAARTLINGDLLIKLEWTEAGSRAYLIDHKKNVEAIGIGAQGSTPALALCIVSLKARADG